MVAVVFPVVESVTSLCHDIDEFSPKLLATQEAIQARSIAREWSMTIKNVVVPLQIDISRKQQKYVEILDDDNEVHNEPRPPRYRRFREKNG
jgi:sulfur transfer complex TusBCD TusB component (DsrH family)